ncbi:MAG: RNA 2'-phosphotransferase [Hyphomonadaceae bacterium]|nr:RNA 2'-phosphotransferase [Hyphomonadaceae bacterium]
MKNPGGVTSRSKLLSFVLRHDPDAAGLTLEPGGWVEIDALLAGLQAMGRPMTRDMLELVVTSNDKKRFSISEDGLRIRAAQGHSVPVDMEYAAVSPPEKLYHGTASRFQWQILEEGLKPMSRRFVHLSSDMKTARDVGKRHGKPVIFEVASGDMEREGIEFHRAENGVWLTRDVQPDFLRLLE